jgi:methionyl-tRNA formyltransferase
VSKLQRLVFFGTPEIARVSLDALVAAGREPLLVVSQPARPAGRGQKHRQPPVAARAGELGLRLIQPARVRDPGFIAAVRELAPDVALVVAFGQIFPPALLALPRGGCVNVHFSLLPKYRGAAPVQAAIAAGESMTGVTTMQMDSGLDSGPVLIRRETAIGPDETAGELAARLAGIGAESLLDTLDGLERGDLIAEPQDDSQASLAPKIGPSFARADWSLPARAVHDRVRALAPRPGLDASLRGAPLKVWRSRLPPPSALSPPPGAPPGTLLAAADEGLFVLCGDGQAVALLEVQRPGRRRLGAAEFARGERLRAGESFGPLPPEAAP